MKLEKREISSTVQVPQSATSSTVSLKKSKKKNYLQEMSQYHSGQPT